MKIKFTKRLLLVAVIICCSFYVTPAMAQSVDGWKELVAGLPAEDHTEAEYFKPIIKTIPGVSYEGFCESQRCLLVLFDPFLYAEEAQLTEIFAANKIKIFPKANTTFRMLSQECGLPVHTLTEID